MLAPARRAAVLTAAYYAAIFMALGAHLPYWPVWMADWGLTEAEIGLWSGIAMVARIAGSTILPALADRFAIRRWMITATSLATAGTVLAHLAIGSHGVLFAATLFLAVVMAPSIPLGEALGLRASVRYGFAYAPVRAFGSVGFLLANIGLGTVLEGNGTDVIVWVVAIGFVVTAALGLVHPGGGGAAGADDRAGPGEALQLLRVPAFLFFALAAALGQSSHVVYYLYSVLDWSAQGLSSTTIGWLWAFGVIVETVLMLGPGRALMARLSPWHAMALAALAGGLRWGAMTWAPGLAWLWPLQGLHALTFALGHLGAMAFLARAVPPRLAGSAQGLMAGIISGLVQAGAMMLAALIVARVDIAAAYWLAAAMSLGAFVAAIALGRTWHGGMLIAETAPERR